MSVSVLMTSPLTRTHLTGASVQFLLMGTVMTVMQATLGVHRMQLLASHAAAHTDTLTGIGNRRAAEERLAELTRAGQPYTLVLFDLDHFKRVNDMHGHAAGDLVLKGVAQATLGHLPPGGVATRWGGEEFLLILPEQSDRQVRGMLDALRLELRHQRHGKVSGVTACFGVATATPGEDPERVLGRADSAMYTVAHRSAEERRPRIGRGTPRGGGPGERPVGVGLFMAAALSWAAWRIPFSSQTTNRPSGPCWRSFCRRTGTTSWLFLMANRRWITCVNTLRTRCCWT